MSSLSIDVRDAGAFLARLRDTLDPGSSEEMGSRILRGGSVHRYGLAGHARADSIILEYVRVPPQLGRHRSGPRFVGRLGLNGRVVTGRLRLPRDVQLLAAGFCAWVGLVALPAIVALARDGFPGRRVVVRPGRPISSPAGAGLAAQGAGVEPHVD